MRKQYYEKKVKSHRNTDYKPIIIINKIEYKQQENIKCIQNNRVTYCNVASVQQVPLVQTHQTRHSQKETGAFRTWVVWAIFVGTQPVPSVKK